MKHNFSERFQKTERRQKINGDIFLVLYLLINLW